MTFLKSTALISLAALFVMGTVQAQNQNSTQTKQTQNQKQQKRKTEPLKQFNDAMGIRFVGYQLIQGNDGKPAVMLRYELTNKSKKDVKEVQFIGAFYHNEQIVYAQEIPLTFNTPLKAKSDISLDISVSAERVPAQALALFSANRTDINAVNGAQLLIFTDKSRIEVK